MDPYNENDFGANQRSTFLKDFAKLSLAAADHKPWKQNTDSILPV